MPQRIWFEVEAFKCCFLREKERVAYSGHHLSANSVSPDPDQKAAVQAWKVANNVKELRSIL